MINEISSGAIVFYNDNQKITFLLLHYSTGHWDFPKGNKEKGESDEDTALREIIEETGISDITILKGFKKELFYKYKRNNELISKRVIYFLAKVKTNNVILSHEHINFEWVQYADALRRLTYKNSKDLLIEGYRFLISSLDYFQIKI